MDSRVYWIWLQQALPLGFKGIGPLLDTFGDAAGVYAADRVALTAGGVSGPVLERLENKDLTAARRILNRVLECGDWVLTPEDALYPLCLRCIPGFPMLLYGRGIMPDLDSRPAVTVVGTRHASAIGCDEARTLAAGLAAGGMVVVSGGAVGIDAAVHIGAIEAQGLTLAVLGCPLTEEYPKVNADLRREIVASGGLLLSEFAPDEPYRCDYHVRNRLLAGLSQGVCLAQTPTRSGARITARLAREYDRDIFALPGALSGHGNDGSHREIQSGAVLVIRAADILEEYVARYPGMLQVEAAEACQKRLETQPSPFGEKTKETAPRKIKKKHEKSVPAVTPKAASPVVCPETASQAAKQVYATLTDIPQPVDGLAALTGLPVPTVLAALTELEMFGCAVLVSGQQYKRI